MSDIWVLWRKLTDESGHYWIEPVQQPGVLRRSRQCPVCQARPINEQRILVSLRNSE